MKRRASTPPLCKRARTIFGNTNLLALSRDEFSHILTFLSIGNTIVFALSNRGIYSIIENIVREKCPITITGCWSTTKVLRTWSKFRLTGAGMCQQISDFLSKNQVNISDVTEHLHFSWCTKDVSLAL